MNPPQQKPPPQMIRTLAIILLIVNSIACIVAWLFIFNSFRTVVISGVIIATLGAFLIGVGGRLQSPRVAFLGGASCFITLLFAALISIFPWTPMQAKTPLLLAGGSFLILQIPLTIRALLNLPSKFAFDPSRCSKCGYLLRGLSHPRCPECGTPFDPAQLDSFSHSV